MINKNSSTRPESRDIKPVKFFIVTLMLAITVGLWSLFSKQSQDAVASAPNQVAGLSVPAPSGIGLNLPPIPTLVPYQNSATDLNVQPIQPIQTAVVQPQVQQQMPIFQQSQGNARPLTNTGSSR